MNKVETYIQQLQYRYGVDAGQLREPFVDLSEILEQYGDICDSVEEQSIKQAYYKIKEERERYIDEHLVANV